MQKDEGILDMGGIRNLNWTTEYLEKSEDTKSSVQERETGYYNIAAIFKLNGREYYQVPEAERQPLLDAFLEESKKHVTPSEERPAKKDHFALSLRRRLSFGFALGLGFGFIPLFSISSLLLIRFSFQSQESLFFNLSY